MDASNSNSQQSKRKVPRRTFLETLGAAVSINLSAAVVGGAEAKYPCPIKADFWVLGGQSNMCILGYRSLQNCGELAHPVTLDRNRVRVFGLDNVWTDPIEPVHWFFTAASPYLRETYRK